MNTLLGEIGKSVLIAKSVNHFGVTIRPVVDHRECMLQVAGRGDVDWDWGSQICSSAHDMLHV